uniref:sodium/potassium/calcium exchanger 4-like n=1 Tax=Styela clava TaxID=7725 RepID=UPI001939935C|nr:sodium/potassium/calcium exchanger 4-like [Styela clava]
MDHEDVNNLRLHRDRQETWETYRSRLNSTSPVRCIKNCVKSNMNITNFKVQRRRKQTLLIRIIFIATILGTAFVFSQFKNHDQSNYSRSSTNGKSFSQFSQEKPVFLRRLLEDSSNNAFSGNESEQFSTNGTEKPSNHHENCTPPSIHEFPKDLFTEEQRLQGAIVIHFFVCFYMFIALAIVCDDYFVPSLDQISEKLKLTEDVAGATFMAAGSSAPELFISIIGVFVARGDVGVGTIVGSAVFNILVIIGLCALFCSEAVPLHWWPLMRDSSYYGIAIAVLIAVIHDSYVSWYESLVMLILYVGYILIMKFNTSLERLIKAARDKTVKKLRGKKHRKSKDMDNNRKDASPMDSLDKKDCEAKLIKKSSSDYLDAESSQKINGNAGDSEESAFLTKTSNGNSSKLGSGEPLSPSDKKPMNVCATQNGTSVVAQLTPMSPSLVPIDEVISGGNRPLRFEDAGLRLMMSNTFAPKTRLRMACKMIINERQNLVVEKSTSDGAPKRVLVRRKTDLSLDGISSTPAISERATSDTAEEVKSITDPDSDGELSSYTHPFIVPRDSAVKFLKWMICWPISFLFFITIPNCSKKRWEKWFMVSFLVSTGWIMVCSYIMVWMGTICGYTLNIPDSIMGITFLAAGTSVPDTIASVIVARQGLGDMAVSNSIGSNVFDILLGLAMPWFLKTAVVSPGELVQINSRGLLWSVFLLLASLFLVIISIHLNGWKLTRKLGILIMIMYCVFLTLSLLIEFNVFFVVNLPMCRD